MNRILNWICYLLIRGVLSKLVEIIVNLWGDIGIEQEINHR